MIAHRGLAYPGQQRLCLTGLQQVHTDSCVIIRVRDQIDNFLLRRPSGLARLGLQEVHEELAVLDDQVAIAADDCSSLDDGTLRPVGLRRASFGECRFDVRGRADRNRSQRLAGEDLVDRPGRTCGDVLDRGQVTQAIENLGRGCRHIVTSFEEMRVSRAQSIGLRLVTKGILDECRVLLVQVASIRVVGPSRARRSAYALAERDPPARGLPNLSRRPKRRNQIRFRQSLGIPARYHEEPASRCSC
ncbi:Uncharacterised protein [Mycobacterium tuberculosis]|uniref:Uncharacterized protein n=1 Tax=Mycobacterium tuberculosis TaxID=1773 RepID=A0A654TZ41_MYCTX|nr:Uncharacterised protein [Mycobacterium tuberculosis]COV59890.1 Uncharacterised protein [Mycobacterium tuberculosis]SIP65061.1 hypothetical protein BN9982_160029 [Mycobacterium tuberculosis]